MPLYDSKRYAVRKFPDGWWSLCKFTIGAVGWRKWRGPFNCKADAEMDCANVSERF